MKMAFLDRDGTILKDYSVEQWPRVTKPEFLPGSIYCLQELSARGFALSILIYQYLIGEGKISEAQHAAYTKKMVDELNANHIKLHAIELCPHARSTRCRCAKPKPGMIEDIFAQYPDIDITQSFLVGDSILDVELAHNAGLRAFSIGFHAANAMPLDSLSDVLLYV
jgi:D-glycero-D-manno-heptose 1,7-bisphosphate phosphatase